MTRIVRFHIGGTDRQGRGQDEDDVFVEVDGDPDGTELVSGDDPIEDAAGTLTQRLSSVRRAVGATLDELGTSLAPDVIRVTVGVKLSAQAGAIIARSSVEGNLRVQMEWDRRGEGGDGTEGRSGGENGGNGGKDGGPAGDLPGDGRGGGDGQAPSAPSGGSPSEGGDGPD